eukprot:Gb_11093 [translate_table: standard]
MYDSSHFFIIAPGDQMKVTLVSIGGNKIIKGGNGIATGPVEKSRRKQIMKVLQEKGFHHAPELNAIYGTTGEDDFVTYKVSHEDYVNIYGPTTGDKVKLGDTDLFAEVEKDFTVYGDECVFGGGKVIRDGMGQATGYSPDSCLDLVITNAVVIDYTGIYKADIGIKGDIISAIGKAGNPDVMEGVSEKMIVGDNTDVIAGEGLIITAGAIDSHVHLICPQLANEAIASGERPFHSLLRNRPTLSLSLFNGSATGKEASATIAFS